MPPPQILLPITLTIAAAAALLNFWLGLRAGRTRMARKIMIGDGGDPVMIARMRAQANFVEYTPFVLILIALIELARGSSLWLWAAGIAYIAVRIAHPFGLDRPAPNPLRAIGILGTILIMVGLAVAAIVVSYDGRPAMTTLAG